MLSTFKYRGVIYLDLTELHLMWALSSPWSHLHLEVLVVVWLEDQKPPPGKTLEVINQGEITFLSFAGNHYFCCYVMLLCNHDQPLNPYVSTYEAMELVNNGQSMCKVPWDITWYNIYITWYKTIIWYAIIYYNWYNSKTYHWVRSWHTKVACLSLSYLQPVATELAGR